VNTAGAAELMDLPGIGEKKAQAIIEYRNSNGMFRSLSDLGEVKGIGPKMLEKLESEITF
jgi:competence protein ComEA